MYAYAGLEYHSVDDRAAAVKQMALDWTALFQNLASQVGELTPDPTSPSGYRIATQRDWDANPPDPRKVTWWKDYAKPRFRAWVEFRNEQLGLDKTVAPDYQAWTARFSTNWKVYEGWKNALDALRADAQRQGFAISVPAATALPPSSSPLKTVGDRDRLVEQLDADFGQFAMELYRRMGGDPSVFSLQAWTTDPAATARRSQASDAIIARSPLYPLWRDTIVPEWNAWKSFYQEQSSWRQFWTNWSTYEAWRRRIADLRRLVTTALSVAR